MKRTLFILLALLAVAAWADDGSYSRHRGYDNQTIIGVSLVDGKLCVEYRENYLMDDIRIYYRDIYGVVNGKIALIKTITGKTIPAQPERVEWPEEK
jgi:hypothetical protein